MHKFAKTLIITGGHLTASFGRVALVATAVCAVFAPLPSLADAVNLVANGSFESYEGTMPSSNGYGQIPDVLQLNDWDYECYSSDCHIGLAGAGKTWVTSDLPDGAVGLYFQRNALIRQEIVAPETGSYLVSFMYSKRSGTSYKNGIIHVWVDGEEIYQVECSTTAFRRGLVVAALSKGSHVLTFEHRSDHVTENNGCSAIDLVSVTQTDNLVANGSFENYIGSKISDKGYPAISESFYATSWETAVVDSGKVGLTVTNSPYVSSYIPDGDVVLFFDKNCSASQRIYVPELGTYVVSFRFRPRGGSYNCGVIYVQIDGETVECVNCYSASSSSGAVFGLAKVKTWLSAGAHALSLAHSDENKTGACTAIDLVSVERMTGTEMLVNGGCDEGSVFSNSGNWGYCIINSDNSVGVSNPGWHEVGSVGLSKASGTWVNSSIDVGTYAAFLQTSSSVGTDSALWQAFPYLKAGIYRLSFSYAGRPGKTGASVGVRIRDGVGISGNIVREGTFASSASSPLVDYSMQVAIPASGSYTLEFRQGATSEDKGTVIDNVGFEFLRGRGLIILVK